MQLKSTNPLRLNKAGARDSNEQLGKFEDSLDHEQYRRANMLPKFGFG